MSRRGRGGRVLANLSALAVSIVVALLLSELILRALGFQPMYVSPERDRYWKYDALLGWAHEPGQEGVFETPQFRTSLRINQQGLRDGEHAYERVDNRRRILVLGDSFAWGYGVEEPERFSELLETSLGVEVVNAGVSGYSTDQELLWLRSEGIKYDVDLVVLVFAGNDVGDNHSELVSTIYYKPRFEREDGRLVLKGSPAPRASAREQAVYNLSQRSALAFFLVQRYFELQSFYARLKASPPEEEVMASGAGQPAVSSFALTIDLMTEIRNEAGARGAEFLIVATDGWWNPRSGESFAAFVEALERHGFPVVDVPGAVGFDPQLMTIPGDGHWNAAGHQFVAERVRELVESHALLAQPGQ